MKRRDWIIRGAAALAGGTLGRAVQLTAAAPVAREPVTRIIDTHTHFYDPTRPEGVPWPPEGSKLHRTVLPKDWLAVASPHGIRETVVVEASQWVEDNQWILDLAEREKCIVGFVGNLDPRDAKFADNLRRFAKNPLYRGVRWRGDLVKVDAGDDSIVNAARLLAEHDLELDLNGRADMLPHAARIAQQIPDLRIVINHLGAPGEPGKLQPEWRGNLKLAAAQKNVYMKVSALVEQVKCEEGQAPRDAGYYLPILDPIWSNFGEDRVIYGSNWPVSDRGAPYDVVFGIVSDYFGGKGREASEKYFWKNSKAVYRWIER